MPIVNGLTTLANVRASLNLAASDTSNDTDLERYIEAATPVIEAITGPMVATSATFTANGGRSSISLPYPIRSVTSVTIDGVASTAYTADISAGIIYAGTSGSGVTTFSTGTQNVVIVAQVGLATIPANVELAARELVRHWWQQGRQGNRPGFGNENTDAYTDLPLGVPTRRLEELLGGVYALPGFA